MRRKPVVYCEQCGGAKPSGTSEFVVFHYLAFCSPDCRDEYRAADEAQRKKPPVRRERPAVHVEPLKKAS